MKKLLTLIYFLVFTSPLFAKEGEMVFGIDAGFGFADIGAEETAQAIANLSGSTTTVTYDRGAFAGRIYLEYGLSSRF